VGGVIGIPCARKEGVFHLHASASDCSSVKRIWQATHKWNYNKADWICSSALGVAVMIDREQIINLATLILSWALEIAVLKTHPSVHLILL
jgi:hypothetical protein